MRWRPILATMLASTLALATPAARGADADLVVRNALVWTADPANPRAEAIAIVGSRVVHAGDNAGADAWTGPGTLVIDAEGRRVLPGLIDAHAHVVNAALGLGRLELRGAATRAGLLAQLREHADGLGEDEWVQGRGWSSESWPDQRPPSAEELDEAASGRPTILTRMDGHSLVASARALELAGIDAEGPADPPGGKIGRLPDGTPDGALYESAMALVYQLAPPPTEEAKRRQIPLAGAHMNALGVTQVGGIESIEDLELLAAIDREDGLTFRTAAIVTGAGDTMGSWRPALEWAAANPAPSPMVRVVGFKGYMDGSLGSRTAWMHEPYLDNPHEHANAGFPLAMVVNGSLENVIQLAARMGLQPAVHAIGDKANARALDWFAEIPDDVRRRVRPRIEHAQHLAPEDVARFGALGVVPSMQPYHKADDGRYAVQRIGDQRVLTSYAFRELVDTGAPLSFGSDWPVVSVSPWLGIHAAVSAQTLDGRTFVPEQSITVEEALVAYTRTAAFCLHAEDRTGMLRVGHEADLIVLDRDVLAIRAEQIPEVAVELTIVGGAVVHQRR